MHLYPYGLSTMAKFSSTIVLEIIPPFFPYSKTFNLSLIFLSLADKNLVEETPEAVIAVDLMNVDKLLSPKTFATCLFNIKFNLM